MNIKVDNIMRDYMRDSGMDSLWKI